MLITNARLITWGSPNRVLEGQAIFIEKGRIVELGDQGELEIKHANEHAIDAHSQYVMPGNICAHTHFYGAYSRGLSIPGPSPADFGEILKKLWWPLDQALDEKGVYYSALICLIDAIKNGTTLLFDHHASPNVIDGSLDIIAKAVHEAGLRVSLCYEVTDRNGDEGADAGIRENLRMINRLKKQPHTRLSTTFGLHASLTLSDRTLLKVRELADKDTGFHIHVAEHTIDQYDSLDKSGLRVIDRLHRHGLLTEKTILVHAVHVDALEIRLIAESGCWVTHQPRSNMNNAVGLPRVEEMLRAGIPVCIGNDGFSNSMWDEWKVAYLVHKLHNQDPRRLNGFDLIKMAVENNAALANVHFASGPFGVITQGAPADLIFVDYHPHTPITVENLPWHIVFGFEPSMVTATIVDGNVLMLNRELTCLDEEDIAHKAMKHAPQIWENYRKQFEVTRS